MGAHYLHQATGCQSCGVGTFSPGGTVSSCVSCPEGKSVAAGQGSSESDCSWSKCTVHCTTALINRYLETEVLILAMELSSWTFLFYINIIIFFLNKIVTTTLSQFPVKVVITLTKWADVHHVEKEHTALEEQLQSVLIVLLRKQWHLVMADHRMTALGVSQNIFET